MVMSTFVVTNAIPLQLSIPLVQLIEIPGILLKHLQHVLLLGG